MSWMIRVQHNKTDIDGDNPSESRSTGQPIIKPLLNLLLNARFEEVKLFLSRLIELNGNIYECLDELAENLKPKIHYPKNGIQ